MPHLCVSEAFMHSLRFVVDFNFWKISDTHIHTEQWHLGLCVMLWLTPDQTATMPADRQGAGDAAISSQSCSDAAVFAD